MIFTLDTTVRIIWRAWKEIPAGEALHQRQPGHELYGRVKELAADCLVFGADLSS